MNQKLLGFFSGFPSRHFPPETAGRLRRALTERDSLVFISAWPAEHERNDDDREGMYAMFTECGMDFGRHAVIDDRMEADAARGLIREASCIFLMGGHPGQQRRLIRELGLEDEIRCSGAVVLGVSAGAINMASRSLDTKESPVPYDGLGLADITVKPHFRPEDRQVLSTLLEISMELPICAVEDDSAIFVEDGRVSCTGKIYWVSRGISCPFSPENISLNGKK